MLIERWGARLRRTDGAEFRGLAVVWDVATDQDAARRWYERVERTYPSEETLGAQLPPPWPPLEMRPRDGASLRRGVLLLDDIEESDAIRAPEIASLGLDDEWLPVLILRTAIIHNFQGIPPLHSQTVREVVFVSRGSARPDPASQAGTR